MAKGGGGAAAAPQCPEELLEFFACMVTLMRQMEAREKALVFEHTRLLCEIEYLKREQIQRLDIAEDTIQGIRRCVSLKDKVAELVDHEKPEARRQVFCEDNHLESLRSLMFALAGNNSELKKKLKEVESRADLTENTVDHQYRAKYSRDDIRKLKEGFKMMVSEKDKEISTVRADKDFAWNQYKLLEKDLNVITKDLKETCSRKDEELKIANKLVCELRLEAQEKDGEIGRLRAEVVSVKENMLMIQKELEQMRSLTKSKDAETDLLERSQSKKWKKGLNKAKRKTKLEGPISTENSRPPRATPVSRGVKTSQKRKRSPHTLSHGLRRCSTRLQGRPAASPTLFTPCFSIPKLTAPSPTQL